MPVSVPPVDRELPSPSRQLLLQGGDEGTVLGVDRAHPAEAVIMLGHLEQAPAGYVAPRGDVLEEGEDIVGTLRPAEGHHHEGVTPLGAHARRA